MHPVPAEYEGWWNGLYDAAFAFVDSTRPDLWTSDEIADLLFLIAHDVHDLVAERLAEEPGKLLAISREALRCDDPDAKWPLAVELGALHEQKTAAELILIGFVHDEDEYVSRRALLSLAKMKSDRTESLAERAWGTGHLYQRIAALSALQTVSSKKLQEYVERAYEDGREYVVQNARKIESA
ncbi:MAG: hypothetical protein V4858_30110 [Pseudomonadota bacterium]